MKSVWKSIVGWGMLLTAMGCDQLKVPVSKQEKSAKTESIAVEPRPEEQAQGHLKVMLDAWTFGDSVYKFKEQHPDYLYVALFDPDRPQKITNYDIAGFRPMVLPDAEKANYEYAYDYTVVVTYLTRSGDEKEIAHL